MTTRTHLLPVAAVLGLIGGSLGVIAGVVQATAGAHIPEWTGHKADPLALGIVTALFSGLSVFSAARLRATRSPSPACRVAVSVGMLVSGGLCFSTVGALWYLPGTLLLGATALVLTSGYGRETRQVVAVGVLGGLTLLVAPWTPGVGLPVVLLLIGTLPFAALTWWGLVSPLLAVLALVLGLVILGRPGRHLSPKTLTT